MRKRGLDIWKCEDCEEEYDDNDPHLWIECDVCSNRYHLESSGCQYKTKDYWKINLENVVFECREWEEFFKGC